MSIYPEIRRLFSDDSLVDYLEKILLSLMNSRGASVSEKSYWCEVGISTPLSVDRRVLAQAIISYKCFSSGENQLRTLT